MDTYLHCRSNILFNRTNIFRDKTSFCQFLTWLLPGLKKMLILIISNTEGVKVLVCPAIFWTLMGNGNNYQCWYMADVIAIFVANVIPLLMLADVVAMLAEVVAIFGG